MVMDNAAGNNGGAPASTARVLTASLAGTAIEFYDFYIYATAAALVFPTLFFPSESPSSQLLASYATMAIAFVARPVGGLVFGHYGDRIGRKSTLVASLMIMGLSTMLIALLPTYAQAGWVAPALLCVLRLGQGIGLGGEWGGATLMAVENAPPGWRYRFGMFPPLGAPVGFVLANGLFLLLGTMMSEAQFFAWGWRLPFLFSAALVAIGMWMRLRVTETPEFKAMLAKGPPPVAPVRETMAQHGRTVIAATLASIAFFVLFYVATAFALGHATAAMGMPRADVLVLQLMAILALALGIIAAGIIADRAGPITAMAAGGVVGVPVSLLFAGLFGSAVPMAMLAALALLLFAMGLSYGTAGGWLPSLFPARVRYTGTSIAFNAAGVLGGGVAPYGAQWLSNHGGLAWVGWYLALSCIISLAALALIPRGRVGGAD
ncbi:MAG: MFS transporter [Sphingopyxis sp.]